MFVPQVAQPTILKPDDSKPFILTIRESPNLWLVYDSFTKTMLIRSGESQLHARTIAVLPLDSSMPYGTFETLFQMSKVVGAGRLLTEGGSGDESAAVHALIIDSLYILDSGFVDGIDERVLLAKSIIRLLEAMEQQDVHQLIYSGLLHRLFAYSNARYIHACEGGGGLTNQIRSDLNLAALWWLHNCLEDSESYCRAIDTTSYNMIYDFAFESRSEGYRVRSFLHLPENRTLLEVLEKWMLTKAYDLKNASLLRQTKEALELQKPAPSVVFRTPVRTEELQRHIQQPRSNSLWLAAAILVPTLIVVFSRTAIMPLFSVLQEQSLPFGVFDFSVSWVTPPLPFQRAMDVVWQLQLFAMLLIFGLSLFGHGWRFPGVMYNRVPITQLPRMSAAIILGYLTLFIDSGPWQLGQRLPISSLIMLVFLALVVSLLYLLIEIRKMLDRKHVLLAFQRALDIMARAFITSWTIGMVLNPLLGPYLSASPSLGEVRLLGIIQLVVNWPNLFLFAVLSLLVGIIVQLLWEEKAITEQL